MIGFAKVGSNGTKTSDEIPAGNPSSILSAMVDRPAPDFSLQNQYGQTVQLSKLHGKKAVLFFNEGIMCYPACWNQIAALGTDQKLNNSQTLTASIVVDAPDQWVSAFKKQPDLGKGTILFDTDKSVSIKYNMLTQPSSMHQGSMPGHTYIIVDAKGVVRYTKDDPQMGVRNTDLQTELDKI